MSSKTKPGSRARIVFQGLFLAIFLLAGPALVREGFRAIQDREYTFEYTEELSWADGSGPSSGGVEQHSADYRGRDAVVFGFGFAALGTMLTAWAAGLAAGLLGGAGRPLPRTFILLIGGLSLASLAVACLALFPVWHPQMLPFYGVVATFVLAIVLPIPAHLRKKVFPGVVGLVILAGMIGFPAFPLFAGIVVFLLAGTHLLVLWPGLAARLDPDRRAGRNAPLPG